MNFSYGIGHSLFPPFAGVPQKAPRQLTRLNARPSAKFGSMKRCLMVPGSVVWAAAKTSCKQGPLPAVGPVAADKHVVGLVPHQQEVGSPPFVQGPGMDAPGWLGAAAQAYRFSQS